MTTIKRRRGRPPGTGKNDEGRLIQVAELMVRDASLRPTTAMKRVIYFRAERSETDATLVRRLQVKWRTSGEGLLARARKAAEPKPPVTLADALAAMVEKWKLDEMFKGISAFDEKMRRALQSHQAVEMFKGISAFDEKMRRAYSSPGWLEFAKSVSTFESRFAETANLQRS
jgi:hypothetical protein